MKTQDIELLKETVIKLIIENTKLEKEVTEKGESNMYWYKKFKELEDLTKTTDEK